MYQWSNIQIKKLGRFQISWKVSFLRNSLPLQFCLKKKTNSFIADCYKNIRERKDFKNKQSYIRKIFFDETEFYWYIEPILRT